jgi:hypothetical protein
MSAIASNASQTQAQAVTLRPADTVAYIFVAVLVVAADTTHLDCD